MFEFGRAQLEAGPSHGRPAGHAGPSTDGGGRSLTDGGAEAPHGACPPLLPTSA
jgi:hypothetical protein